MPDRGPYTGINYLLRITVKGSRSRRRIIYPGNLSQLAWILSVARARPRARARSRLIRGSVRREDDFVSGNEIRQNNCETYEADDEIMKREVNDVSTGVKRN